MNKNTPNNATLWIDKTLNEQQASCPDKLTQTIESVQNCKTKDKTAVKGRNYLFEMPFVERFKDKLFTFNKIGRIYKLDDSSQSPKIRASLIFSKNNLKKPSCLRSVFKTKRSIIETKKITESSRVSLQSKDTLETNENQRQTKSLDVSKVTTVFLKENKYRYGLDCSEIKEEEIQETIVKNPHNFRKLYTPHDSRKGKQNTRRAIQFQSEGNNSECEKSEQHEKPFFKNLKSKQMVSESGLTERGQNVLPEVGKRPNESHLSRRLIINTQQREALSTEKGEELLPKLKLPKERKKNVAEKEKLYTIR